MRLPVQYDTAEVLEQYLGDPLHSQDGFSFKNAVELDEQEAFPQAACQLLERWGFHQYYIPAAYGGKFTSYETMLALMRVVARRDLTVAIGHGKTYLGSVSGWVGGTEAQKHALARLIADRVPVSLGLTERAHGSDLLASEVQATPVANGFVLSGEKWLINNATRGRVLTVFAQTDVSRGARGFSLFLVDKDCLTPGAYICLPKVKTHGIRGADISGIRFHAAFLPHDALIGPRGSGLELVLKGLQITRTMCVSLSLGAADTALRATLQFALSRRLYGNTVFAIPYARSLLVETFLDLIVCDCVAIAATRALHVATAQMSLWSAVIKYFVPTTIEQVMHTLSVVLGARYYLREAHWEGIFQKMVRDNALVSLFDGSTVVNLHAIALQLRHLAKQRTNMSDRQEGELATCLENTFALDIPLPDFDPERLTLFNHGRDDVLQGLEMSLAHLETLRDDPEVAPELLQAVIALTQDLYMVLDTLGKILKDLPLTKGYNEPPALFELAKQYCTLHAAATCVHMWLYNRRRLSEFFAKGEWLVLCLHRLVRTFQPMREPLSCVHVENIAQELIRLYEDHRLFSIVPFRLARPVQVPTEGESR
jgi:alkylation response protein AidB-like acyl-CoA dehydrogenase